MVTWHSRATSVHRLIGGLYSSTVDYAALDPARFTFRSFAKWAQEMMKTAAVKAHSRVLHCECGRTMRDIKREDITFKWRNVLCRSHCHCTVDDFIWFSRLICNPADQEKCIGAEKQNRKTSPKKSLSFSPFDSSDGSLRIVTVCSQQKVVYNQMVNIQNLLNL